MSKGLLGKRHLKALSGHEADWGENNMCKPRNYLWLILIAIILLVIYLSFMGVR